MKNKITINSKASFEFCKSLMTKEEFYDKFELSLELTAKLTAEFAMKSIQITDRTLSPGEIKELVSQRVI
jgi:hypothetical protein